MQANLPNDPFVRNTMASLGPGAKDSTLEDVAAWIRQLENLVSQDAMFAPASFRTDISGSCRSTFPASGTAAQTIELQTKVIKGHPLLSELHMEKVIIKKKKASGEAKLRLSVERGPVLILLTITDLHGTIRMLRAVAVEDNALIPIKHPATTIEVTAIPIAPDELLERLRLVEAKHKELREQNVQQRGSPQGDVARAPTPRPADEMTYMTKKWGSSLIEHIVDRETGTVTIKSSGAHNLHGPAAAVSLIIKNGEMEVSADTPQMNAVLAPVLKSYLENPHCCSELHRREEAILKEEKAVLERLPSAKRAEKKRLLEELENMDVEYAKLTGLLVRTVAGGWMSVTEEERFALFEKAMEKVPKCTETLACQARAALADYNKLKENHETTSNKAKKKRLSMQLGRIEIEFDEAMNHIADIADRGWLGAPKEELVDQWTKASTNDPSLAYRASDALSEYNDITRKLQSTSDPGKKKRLSTLLGRKESEFNEAMNEVAAIPDSSEQGDSDEVNDVSVRMNEVLVLDESP